MNLRIGDVAPDFEAETTQGRIRFHEWMGDGWAMIFSHPKDFTPVCSTELGHMAAIKPEFDVRNTKVLGLSIDPVEDHVRWLDDIQAITGHRPNYPLVGDRKLEVAKLYGMLPAEENGEAGKRTAVDNQTVRNVFIIGPDKKIKMMLAYPMSTGRNFKEILRALDSIQLTAMKGVATPVNWENGEDVIILPAVSNEQAEKLYPGGWHAPRPYIRYVPQPQ